jgi:hypothetical protein
LAQRAHAVLREGNIVRSECGIKRGKRPGTEPSMTKRVPFRFEARAADVKPTGKAHETVLGEEKAPQLFRKTRQ